MLVLGKRNLYATTIPVKASITFSSSRTRQYSRANVPRYFGMFYFFFSATGCPDPSSSVIDILKSQVMGLEGSFPPSKSHRSTTGCAGKAEEALQRLSSVADVWTWVKACWQDDFKVNRAYAQEKTSRDLHLHPSSAKLLEKGSFLCVAKNGINPNPADVPRSDLLAHHLFSVWLFLSAVFWAVFEERRQNPLSTPQSVWKCQCLQPQFQMLLILLEA